MMNDLLKGSANGIGCRVAEAIEIRFIDLLGKLLTESRFYSLAFLEHMYFISVGLL